MKKIPKLLFAVILVLMFTLPGVLAACKANPPAGMNPSQNQLDALKGTGEAFKCLFEGDVGGMFQWLLSGGAIYIVSTFLILYYLMVFVLKSTLMKGDEHKGARNGLAIGIALLGTATPAVYKLLVGLLGGVGLIALVLIFVGFAIFTFLRNAKAEHYKAGAENYRNRADQERAKAEFEKEEGEAFRVNRDEKMNRDLVRKEEDLAENSEEVLDAMIEEEHAVEKQLTYMQLLISQVAGISPERRSAHISSILSRASAFAATIHSDSERTKKLRIAIQQIEELEVKEVRLENDEHASFEAYKKYFFDSLEKGVKDKHKKEQIKAMFEKQMAKLLVIFKRFHDYDAQRHTLLEHARQVETRVAGQYEQLMAHGNNLVGYLKSADTTTALQEINQALALNKEMVHEEETVKSILDRVNGLIREKKKVEKEFFVLMKEIKELTLKEEKEVEDEEDGDEKKKKHIDKLRKELKALCDHFLKIDQNATSKKSLDQLKHMYAEIQRIYNEMKNLSGLAAKDHDLVHEVHEAYSKKFGTK